MDRVGIPQEALVFGVTVIVAVDIIGILSNPVPIYMYTVVQQCILDTDYDCIVVGLLLKLHSGSKIS